jgi:hypothetical protein
VSLLAALTAALVRPDVSESRCVTCGALVTSHFDGRLRWTGCAAVEQPQPQPQPLVGLSRLLDASSQLRLVHGASVAQPNRDAARCEMHQGGR